VSGLPRQIAPDIFLRNSQDAIAATGQILKPAEVDDSIDVLKTSDDAIITSQL
jgi:hypothetical protein